jgi:hypothetical protein
MIKFRAIILENEDGWWVRITHYDPKTRTIKAWTQDGKFTVEELDNMTGRKKLAEFVSYHLYHNRDSFQVPIVIKTLESIRDMVGILDKE